MILREEYSQVSCNEGPYYASYNTARYVAIVVSVMRLTTEILWLSLTRYVTQHTVPVLCLPHTAVSSAHQLSLKAQSTYLVIISKCLTITVSGYISNWGQRQGGKCDLLSRRNRS